MGTVDTHLADEYFGDGVYLFLGAADTGKSSLISNMAARLAAKRTVAIVDADMGQSHIGPPGTVGWAIAIAGQEDLSKLNVEGIAFVGNTSPVAHLLQLTGAVELCLERAKSKAKTVLIDTPGFVSEAAACVLWWEIARILKPKAIIAVSRQNELVDLTKGLQNSDLAVEMIGCGEEVKTKSPEQRRAYRQKKYTDYFAEAKTFEIGLKGIAVQTCRRLNSDNGLGLIAGLRDANANDLAMGFIVEWHDGDKAIIKSPDINPKKISCIVVGDATVDLPI